MKYFGLKERSSGAHMRSSSFTFKGCVKGSLSPKFIPSARLQHAATYIAGHAPGPHHGRPPLRRDLPRAAGNAAREDL